MKARIKSLDEVSEGLRGEYVQNGDMFDLKVESYTEGGAEFGLSDTTGLKAALNSERSIAKQLKADLKAAQDASGQYAQFEGLTADKIQGLMDFKANSSKSVDSAVEAMKNTMQAKLDEQKTLWDGERAQNQKIHHDAAITAAVGNASDLIVEGELSREVFGTFLRQNTKADLDGSVKVIDPSTGLERMSAVVGSTEAMSISELMSQAVANPKYASMVKGSGNAGSGNVGGSGGGDDSGMTLEKYQAMSGDQKVALSTANPEQFAQMQQAEIDAL